MVHEFHSPHSVRGKKKEYTSFLNWTQHCSIQSCMLLSKHNYTRGARAKQTICFYECGSRISINYKPHEYHAVFAVFKAQVSQIWKTNQIKSERQIKYICSVAQFHHQYKGCAKSPYYLIFRPNFPVSYQIFRPKLIWRAVIKKKKLKRRYCHWDVQHLLPNVLK